MHACLEHRVGDFAIDIELELPGSGVTDADRTSALETRQPRHLPFRQTPLTTKAIHNLQLVRAASNRTNEPVSPVPRLFVVASGAEREQGEGGVPEPAITIVPVAHTADLFGKRSRRCGNDASGRQIGQSLQRDKRALDRVCPTASGSAAI